MVHCVDCDSDDDAATNIGLHSSGHVWVKRPMRTKDKRRRNRQGGKTIKKKEQNRGDKTLSEEIEEKKQLIIKPVCILFT